MRDVLFALGLALLAYLLLRYVGDVGRNLALASGVTVSAVLAFLVKP
jgi:hypothetical protein